MGNKLYIGNLDFQTTADDLRDLFTGAGHVLSAQVILDRESRRSKGFAFVEMSSAAQAQQAITLYNGHLLNDRPLVVSEARERESPPVAANLDRTANVKAMPRFREIKHKSRGGANKRRI